MSKNCRYFSVQMLILKQVHTGSNSNWQSWWKTRFAIKQKKWILIWAISWRFLNPSFPFGLTGDYEMVICQKWKDDISNLSLGAISRRFERYLNIFYFSQTFILSAILQYHGAFRVYFFNILVKNMRNQIYRQEPFPEVLGGIWIYSIIFKLSFWSWECHILMHFEHVSYHFSFNPWRSDSMAPLLGW